MISQEMAAQLAGNWLAMGFVVGLGMGLVSMYVATLGQRRLLKDWQDYALRLYEDRHKLLRELGREDQIEREKNAELDYWAWSDMCT